MSSEKAREAPPLIRKIVDPPIVGAISETSSNQENNEERQANFFNVGFNSTNEGDSTSSEVDKISSVPFLGKQQNEFN